MGNGPKAWLVALITYLTVQVGTSSFAASHISHQDANQHYNQAKTPDWGPAAWTSFKAAERHLQPRSGQLRQGPENARDMPESSQMHQAKASAQDVPQQDKNNNELYDGTKEGVAAGKPGESISPQESCAHGEVTAQQPGPTADRKASLDRLSRAFQAKKPSDKGEKMLAKGTPPSKNSGLIEEARHCSSPPKKQVAWSKSFAKAGFNGSNLHPITKKVAFEIPHLQACPCLSFSEHCPIRCSPHL